MLKDRLQESLRIKFLILFSTVIAIIFLMPGPDSVDSEVSVGSVWLQEDLIAAFSFPVLKEHDQLAAEIEAAKRGVYPVYKTDENVLLRSVDSLKRYVLYLEQLLAQNQADAFENQESPTFLSSQAFKVLTSAKTKYHDARPILKNIESLAAEMLRAVYSRGVIQIAPTRIKSDSIALRSRNIDIIQPAGKYLKIENKSAIIENFISEKRLAPDIHLLLSEFINHFLQPNILFQPQLTKEEEELAEKRVTRITGIITENERIVGKHELITNEIKRKIESYRKARGENLTWDGLLLQGMGKFLHIFSLLLLLSIYIFLFRKRIFKDNLKLAVFAILLLWISLLSYIINLISVNDAARFLIFIPAASMLITITFDSRVGFYATAIFAFVCGGLRGNDYSFVVMNLVAGALAVYTVRDIKNRTQIFRSFIYILTGYFITILSFGLERFEPVQRMLVEMMFAGTNALVSPVLTYGMLIFFEKIFRITTDLTLLELSNSDHPLLRDLAKKAPGTFSHSLAIGMLAENAALAIGANALLAKVGAYYHDVGKMLTPKTFVENQGESTNIHDELMPLESARLLKEHVQNGIALARKNGLPEDIIAFIPRHHGTSVMYFFLEKAKRVYGESKVNINDFRYPGPKPETKETAIVMLADTCESAVRSMDDPDPEKVENLIRNLIDNRIADDQLSESMLTFADIQKIRSTFTEILVGQNYRRIKYPDQDKLENSN